MVVLDYPFRILTAFALIAASLEAAKSKERLRNLRDSSRRKIQEANDLSEECLAIISNPTFIGDGYCDLVGNYNTQECNYDGGDCCPQTCVDATYTCKPHQMDCRDPEPGNNIDLKLVYGVSDECLMNITNIFWLGDGYCDRTGGYNTELCNYDGGDCCSETCKDGTYKCKSKNMDCIDPYAGGLPLTQSLTTSTFSNVSLTSTDTNITSMDPTYSNTTSVPGSMYMYYEGEILSNSTEDYSITSMNETYAYIYNQTR